METQKNTNSSLATMSALAGLLFFSPLVKYHLSNENKLTESEKSFVMGYIQIGYVNLIFLGIICIAAILNLIEHINLFSWIINIGGYAIAIISIFSMICCAFGLSMRKEGESIMQPIQHKKEVLKSFIPGWNFYLRFRQTDYSMPYRWLKESVFLWTMFIFLTLLLGSSIGIGMLILITARVVLLMLNIDIIPVSMKKTLNNLFVYIPEEITAYIFTPLVVKIDKADYNAVLQDLKINYAKGQQLGIGIIIQYIIFIGLIVLLYLGTNISLGFSLVAFAGFVWIIRTIIFYRKKMTLPKIPIISEIVSLIFK